MKRIRQFFKCFYRNYPLNAQQRRFANPGSLVALIQFAALQATV